MGPMCPCPPPGWCTMTTLTPRSPRSQSPRSSSRSWPSMGWTGRRRVPAIMNTVHFRSQMTIEFYRFSLKEYWVGQLKCLDNFVRDFGSEELIRFELMVGELG